MTGMGKPGWGTVTEEAPGPAHTGAGCNAAGQKCREHDLHFCKVYKHMAVGVAKISLGFRIENANDAYCRMLGYTEAELKGKHLRDITHKDMVEQNLSKHAQLGSGIIHHYRMEKKFIHKDGRVIYGILDANLIRDDQGRPSYFLGSVLDITERRKTEEALAESEERLSLAMEASRIGLCDWDVKTGDVTYSKIWADLLGYTLEEVPPSLSFWKDRIHPDDRAATLESLDAHLRNREKLFESEHRLLSKSGEWVWVLGKGRITKTGESGEPSRVSIIMLDINEHRKLEARLKQKAKLEAVGTLAGGIAHDFNNILWPMIGYSEMLKEDLPCGSPFQDHINEILKASLRAKDLVNQILIFSRKGEQVLRPVKLQPIVQESLKLLRASIPSTVEILREIAPGCGRVTADATQMHQIIMNLVTNAYQSLTDACGRIRVGLAPFRLERPGPFCLESPGSCCADMSPGPYVLLTVEDNGTGMEKDILDKVFDPYFTTKPIGRGTGLGLSTVQGIIKRCNGGIRISSEPGKGTKIQVYLPAAGRSPAGETRRKGLEPFQKGHERILLVDDEAPVLAMEEKMLHRLGYRVNAKRKGRDALDEFRKNADAYDLLVTDMTMPGMTGTLLAREIRKIRPGIPVILCSGLSDRATGNPAESGGIDAFLPKPVAMKTVAETVRKVLNRAKKTAP